MLIPELPDYLTSLGGEDYKGLIISLFTLTAGLSRPFSGRLTDRIGRVPVMAFGSLVCFVCGFFYPIVTTVYPFLFLRLVHGFSTGFKPTGTAAYIADIVPINRRGEAMGMHGLLGGLGMAFGPALGSWIADTFSINVLFYVSSMFALISIAILYNIKETLPKTHQEKFTINSLKIKREDMFDPMVLPAAIVIFLTSFSFGSIVTLTPDLSKSIGLKNKGFYFLVYTLASLFIRVVAGKFSDKNGRISVLRWGCMTLLVAMTLTTFASNIYIFVAAAIFFGLGMGVVSPITQAWTVDLCEEENRGRALATMYISLEAGIGLGALFSAWIYQNDASRFPIAFASMGSLTILALIYLYSPKIRRMKAND
ncbi:Staphylopine export protein [Emticicia aquatica]|uniref:Staphylopine export protein n=2 Tax=Emticicia aquatica TaxID=1681835 RepID=A0ABN8F1Q2_9BACT|nr:Staphylopine export protein [Emticicia aquatica]